MRSFMELRMIFGLQGSKYSYVLFFERTPIVFTLAACPAWMSARESPIITQFFGG